MGDPYWRYGASADGGSVPRSSFPGYLPTDSSLPSSHHLWSGNNLHAASSDYPPKDILPVRPGVHGLDDVSGSRVPPQPVIAGFTAGASIKGYPTVDDPNLIAQRRDGAPGVSPGIPDTINERSSFLRNVDSLLPPVRESNILFVDGLPKDCTRREVGHLFRPFIGFKEIRVVHREPRHSGDKAMVLCFVEFTDARCSQTAMEALQGYKFDDKKPESPILRIQFAHFPFHLPSEVGGRR